MSDNRELEYEVCCATWQAVDTDEGDLASQQGKRRAVPDEAEEGLSETEGSRPPCMFMLPRQGCL